VFGIGPATRIYLALGATDMRKGFEGLYGLVRELVEEVLEGGKDAFEMRRSKYGL